MQTSKIYSQTSYNAKVNIVRYTTWYEISWILKFYYTFRKPIIRFIAIIHPQWFAKNRESAILTIHQLGQGKWFEFNFT